ncbi:MAG: bifunctional diaminohydroxyphosphoribosylaminopyrimidine deaminase/5-amino-6-(5-phosphoribosylamino)uracil reductase RibD [Gemmatimonadetes bacterium]|nr:bifunctional diaminohydroxyphosphoribosylaminopyrimidine deaminase/5-amino-6-(5-phosphoribosylamino)uracil reductase RibD [Gemmatimonadota bacterium]
MTGDGPAHDAAFMRRALVLAEQGWGQAAPNPMVGAVVVSGGTVVGEGFHARHGGPHGERVAVERAGARARGATLYVTLEPCTHTGKQPPCAPMLLAAGLSRAVIAAPDPNPLARGGAAFLRGAGIAVTTGVCEAEARELNAPFYFEMGGADRPWVTIKLATSREGAIAPAGREPRWMTGAPSRADVHRLRAGADAIAVGLGTVRTDDPLLTIRHAAQPRVPPVRVVFDREARLPVDSHLATTARAQPVLVVAERPDAARARALAQAGVEVLTVRDLADGLRALRGRGVRHLLVEGGAQLASALVRASLADRVIIFETPVELGGGALPAFEPGAGDPIGSPARWRQLDRRRLGDDERVTYAPRG